MISMAVKVYAQTSVGFSINAIIPDNQIDKKQSYFDLMMLPGDEQTVEIVITNSRDEDLVVQLGLNAASCGRNGLIDYTTPRIRDDIMTLSITDVAVLQTESVTVPARGSKPVAINIKMPEEPFEGVILGGISVSSSETDSSAQTQGVSLSNKISYVIALKLAENTNLPAADFELRSVTPELVNFKTAVVVKLRNNAARIVKGMEVKAQVYRKGSDSVLHELMLEDAEMAPLSSGDFVIDWKKQPLERGTYRLKMTAVYEGRTWEWDEEFTIGTEAHDLNNTAVGLAKDYKWFYIFAGAAVLTVFWLAAYRSGKHRKTNKEPTA